MTTFTPLQKAVINQLGYDVDNVCQDLLDTLNDVRNHGAYGGVSGFTYFHETMSFWKAHSPLIVDALKALAGDLGEGLLEMVAGFNCLRVNHSVNDIGLTIYGREENTDIENALAWFALEHVAHELEPLELEANEEA